MSTIHKAMTILYKVHDNLYVNLTNKCPCSCAFCLRNNMENVNSEEGSLWLEHEPDYEEVVEEFKRFNLDDYREIVFCGFGEPTERLELLLQLARNIKETHPMPIRINTNGLSDLIHGRSTAPLLEGLIDTVSISLNTPDRDKYNALVRPRFGIESFDAMLSFAAECTKYVPKVVMTTVETTLTPEEEQKCRDICNEIGATYRIRAWEG